MTADYELVNQQSTEKQQTICSRPFVPSWIVLWSVSDSALLVSRPMAGGISCCGAITIVTAPAIFIPRIEKRWHTYAYICRKRKALIKYKHLRLCAHILKR